MSVSVSVLWGWLEPVWGPHPAGVYEVKAAHERYEVGCWDNSREAVNDKAETRSSRVQLSGAI